VKLEIICPSRSGAVLNAILPISNLILATQSTAVNNDTFTTARIVVATFLKRRTHLWEV
jgi:hypothetical protein